MEPIADLAEQDPAVIRHEIDCTRSALIQKI